MLANSWGTSQRLRCGAGDRWTSIIPLFHCAGCVLNLLGSLQSGATYVGVPAFDPVAMFKIIESERCTMLSGVPTSYAAMLDHPERGKFDLSSLRAGTCGGADADPEILRRCATEFPMPRLAQVYGQTELSTLVTCPEYEDDDRFATAGPGRCRAMRSASPIRRPVPCLPPAESARSRRAGPWSCAAITTSRRRRPRPSATTAGCSTGDLGYLREDGRLVVAGGRLRDMIIRGGENIYPVEIENLLRGHPAVGEIAVFGLPDAYYGEMVAPRCAIPARPSASLAAFATGASPNSRFPRTSSG